MLQAHKPKRHGISAVTDQLHAEGALHCGAREASCARALAPSPRKTCAVNCTNNSSDEPISSKSAINFCRRRLSPRLLAPPPKGNDAGVLQALAVDERSEAASHPRPKSSSQSSSSTPAAASAHLPPPHVAPLGGGQRGHELLALFGLGLSQLTPTWVIGSRPTGRWAPLSRDSAPAGTNERPFLVAIVLLRPATPISTLWAPSLRSITGNEAGHARQAKPSSSRPPSPLASPTPHGPCSLQTPQHRAPSK